MRTCRLKPRFTSPNEQTSTNLPEYELAYINLLQPILLVILQHKAKGKEETGTLMPCTIVYD